LTRPKNLRGYNARIRIRAILAGLALCPILILQVLSDTHKVEFDTYSDFSTLKTFALREGKVNSPTFAMGIADNNRESPNAKQRSVELVSTLRALSET